MTRQRQVINKNIGVNNFAPTTLDKGELFVNYAANNEKLFIENSDGEIVSFDAHVVWNNIENKPTKFEPADHKHISSDVTDFTSATFNVLSNTTNVPASADYLPSGMVLIKDGDTWKKMNISDLYNMLSSNYLAQNKETTLPNGVKYSGNGFMSAADKAKLDGLKDYTLTVASTTELGGIKLGYVENGKTYAVKVDGNGNAFVEVPWEGSTPNTTYTLSKENGKIKLVGSDGSTTEVDDDNTTYEEATNTTAGLMSAADKAKLDKIENEANKITVDAELLSGSTNPVQNKAVKSAIDGVIGSVTAIVSGAPETYDTLKEIADWIGEHESVYEGLKSMIVQSDWNTTDVKDFSYIKNKPTVLDGITPQLKSENDHIYVSTDNGVNWDDLGNFKGQDGVIGVDGKSAYDLWLEAGNVGDMSAFLASLKGADGKDGVDGTNGKDGEAFTYDKFTSEQLEGLRGPQGVKGEQGVGITIKTSESNCTELGDAYINGAGHIMILNSVSPRQFTDGGEIRGPQGEQGPQGEPLRYSDLTEEEKSELRPEWRVSSHVQNEDNITYQYLVLNNGYLDHFEPLQEEILMPYIGKNNHWYIGGEDTNISALGKTPVITINSNGYWVIDGVITMTKAKGEDGADGTNGTNGTNGADGITPRFKIKDDYWYVSYDNGASWGEGPLGKAKGDKGADGTYTGGTIDYKTVVNSGATNGNVALTLRNGSTNISTHGISGRTGISVTSDNNGNIVITGTEYQPVGNYSTTSHTHSIYASAITINGETKTVSNNAVNLGDNFVTTANITNHISGYTDGLYVKKTGDTMTGDLIMDGNSNIIVSGGSVSAQGGFFETSDERLKNFGEDIDVNFNKLKELPKKYFTWKEGIEGEQIGTSAQKVKEIYPQIVAESEDGMLSVSYEKLAIVALAAIDKLNEKVEALTKEIEELKK